VNEAQVRGVKCEASDLDRVALRLAVDRIAKHGMAEVGEVDPDLVGAAGPQFGLDQRDRPEWLRWPQHGMCRAPAGSRSKRGPARARTRASDAARHHDLSREGSAHEREIAALDAVTAKLTLQGLGRQVRERQHHHARGVAVEPVHDVHPARLAAAALDLGRRAAQDGVFLLVERRVGEQARRLADNDDIAVEEEHFDRRRARWGGTARQVGAVRDRIGWRDPATCVERHHAVDEHVADLDLTPGAREGRGQHFLHDAAETPSIALHACSLAPGTPEPPAASAVDKRA